LFGDPKKSGHPAVNADFRPEFLQHADGRLVTVNGRPDWNGKEAERHSGMIPNTIGA
jgi:hypothetical protein